MDDTLETHFGFKRITAQNWQHGGLPLGMLPDNAHDWIPAFLDPHLESHVPSEIARLFEVARGCMVYAWFFYPLLALGSEQCYRVLEAAVRLRCEQAGIATKRQTKNGKTIRTSFAENIESLIKAGIIPESDKMRWEAIRNLRNIGSHPEFQKILSPGIAIPNLFTTAELLNALF